MKRIKRSESARAVALPASAEEVGQLFLDFLSQRNDTPAVAPPTFGELTAVWVEWVTPRRVSPAGEKRAAQLLEALYEETEATLTAGKVEDALAAVRAKYNHGAHYSNRVRDIGGKIIRHAQRHQKWGGVNPFALARRAKAAARHYELLAIDELSRTQRYLIPPRSWLFRLTLHLGFRPGELFALRKPDVDWKRKLMHVQRSHHRDETKTGGSRLVPIVPAIELDLREAYDDAPGELIFPRPDGGRWSRKTRLTTEGLRTAMRKAGIPAERRQLVRWYDLRHMAATYHHRAGADALCVALVMGHSIRGTTHGVYTHPDIEHLRRELSKWALSR